MNIWNKLKERSIKMETELKRLQLGNDNFVDNELTNSNQDSVRRNDVVGGQKPFAVVLTCSDSRVVPELMFDTGIGELFVIRVAGNIANTSSIASIEYAVAHLNISLIVVLGHQNCGAVTSALAGSDSGKNLDHLLHFVKPAISSSKSTIVDEVSTIHAKLTAEKLISDSTIISDAIDHAKVKIVPAFYSLESGKVNFFEYI